MPDCTCSTCDSCVRDSRIAAAWSGTAPLLHTGRTWSPWCTPAFSAAEPLMVASTQTPCTGPELSIGLCYCLVILCPCPNPAALNLSAQPAQQAMSSRTLAASVLAAAAVQGHMLGEQGQCHDCHVLMIKKMAHLQQITVCSLTPSSKNLATRCASMHKAAPGSTAARWTVLIPRGNPKHRICSSWGRTSEG